MKLITLILMLFSSAAFASENEKLISRIAENYTQAKTIGGLVLRLKPFTTTQEFESIGKTIKKENVADDMNLPAVKVQSNKLIFGSNAIMLTESGFFLNGIALHANGKTPDRFFESVLIDLKKSRHANFKMIDLILEKADADELDVSEVLIATQTTYVLYGMEYLTADVTVTCDASKLNVFDISTTKSKTVTYDRNVGEKQAKRTEASGTLNINQPTETSFYVTAGEIQIPLSLQVDEGSRLSEKLQSLYRDCLKDPNHRLTRDQVAKLVDFNVKSFAAQVEGNDGLKLRTTSH